MTRPFIWILLVGACGCALTSRGNVLSVRYFDPVPSSARLGLTSVQARQCWPVIRLGRVRAARYLRDRIAYRDSEHEVGFYEDREWTERPDAFVRRALVRKLFDERGFEQATGGPVPSLDVDVMTFDELRIPGRHGVRVELHYRVRDGDVVLEEHTIAAEREVPSDRFDDVVRAMGAALDDVSEQIADDIVRTASRGSRGDSDGGPRREFGSSLADGCSQPF